MTDLISIIVPVYNVEQYIKRCLDSIINQTYINWELILVNDGSSDNSGNICKSYAEKNKQIVYLEQNNQGQSVARNKALEIARGKYVCFVDSDDWIDNNYLKYLYEVIKKNNSEVVICGYYVSNKFQNKVQNVPSDKMIIRNSEFKSKLIKGEIHSFLFDKIFRKDILNKIRFIPGVYYEDYLFYHDLLPRIKKDVPIINKPLYYYYQRGNSTTNNKTYKNALDYFNAHKARFELNYINNDERAYCLKELFPAYLRFLQIDDYNCKSVEYAKEYIKHVPSYLFAKAKKLMTPKSLTLFLLAFYFPIVYKSIFVLYKFISCLRGNKY